MYIELCLNIYACKYREVYIGMFEYISPPEDEEDCGQGRRGQSSLAGTQSLDSRWKWLKVYIPQTVKARRGRTTNPTLNKYVFSFQFRANALAAGVPLWAALGRAVRKHRRSAAK